MNSNPYRRTIERCYSCGHSFKFESGNSHWRPEDYPRWFVDDINSREEFPCRVCRGELSFLEWRGFMGVWKLGIYEIGKTVKVGETEFKVKALNLADYNVVTVELTATFQGTSVPIYV
jgi:hypothetical protein